MTDKEKLDAIRAEIHRIVAVRGYDREMANDLFAFIDSLPNEPVSEDLEEEIDNYVKKNGYDGLDSIEEVKYIANHFAEWQKEKDDEEKVLTYKHGFEDCKEQMMAKAIDAQCFGFQGAALFSFRLPSDNYLVGSKVKVIVIKED